MTLKTKAFGDIITFTRASGGGRFNSSGVYEYVGNNVPRLDYDPVTLAPRGILIEEQRTNLLTYSSDLDRRSWVGTNGGKYTPYNALAPDGTVKATLIDLSAGSTAYVSLSGVSTSGATTVCYSFFVKGVAGETVAVRFNTNGQATIAATDGVPGDTPTVATKLVTLTGAWQRVSIYVAMSAAVTIGYLYLGDRRSGQTAQLFHVWGAQLEAGAFPTSYIPTPATFTGRASTGTYFDADGVLKIAAAGEARYTHAYVDGKWVSAGLLLEGQSTNLFRYSQDFTNAAWLTHSAAGVTRVVQEDGATLLTTTSSGLFYISQSVTLDSTKEHTVTLVCGKDTVSKVIMRSGEVVFDLDRVTATGGGNIKYNASNGQYTLTLLFPAGIGAGVIYFNTYGPSPAGMKIKLYRVQLEASSTPTSYIPTTTAQVTRAADTSTSSQVTRAADIASVNDLSPWYNASEGTLVFKGNTPNTGTRVVATLSDGTLVNRLQFMATPTRRGAAVVSGGIVQCDLGAEGNAKAAFAFTENNFRLVVGGGSPSFDTSGSIPSVSQMRLGSYPNNSNYLNGHIESIRYYPRALSNTELQRITA